MVLANALGVIENNQEFAGRGDCTLFGHRAHVFPTKGMNGWFDKKEINNEPK